jgi:predicted nucleotidyltransferase
VRFILIGAAAFPVYGYTRATVDVDLFIAADEENARNTRQALLDFGFDLTDVSLSDLRQKKLLIRQYALDVDIHPFAKGVEFEDVWKHRVMGTVGDQPANFASLDDLIKMKKAAGRKKDVEDLKELRRIKRSL